MSQRWISDANHEQACSALSSTSCNGHPFEGSVVHPALRNQCLQEYVRLTLVDFGPYESRQVLKQSMSVPHL